MLALVDQQALYWGERFIRRNRMKKYFLVLFATALSPLAAQMAPQHFYLNLSEYEGNWQCTKKEVNKNGQYFETWTRMDLPQECEVEQIFVVSSPTQKQNVNMRRLMRKSLFPVRYLPGTRTQVRRETANEAVLEWQTPNNHHSVVRLLVESNMCHCITYLHKGYKLSEEEVADRAEFLDSLMLTFSH